MYFSFFNSDVLVSLQQCAQWFKAKQLSHEFPVFCSPRHAPPHTLHCNIGCTNAVDTMFSCGIPDEVSLLFLFFYFLCTYCLRVHPPGAPPQQAKLLLLSNYIMSHDCVPSVPLFSFDVPDVQFPKPPDPPTV